MAKLLVLLVVGVVAGGVAYLATSDMPPPTAKMEKVIPNDRFN
jgi:hypothetical protein